MNRMIRSAVFAGVAGSASALAQPVDFNDSTTWMWPDVGDGFAVPDWQVLDGGDSVAAVGNIIPSVYYDDGVSIMNKRISGVMNPGTDDDVVGLVFGYTLGDNFNVEDGEYLVLDWKGTDQNFNWIDPVGAEGTFHDITGTTMCRQGIRLMRAVAVPTADELWGGVDLAENNEPPNAPGAVFELARADILGRAPYHDFDWQFTIDYTATNIKVWVNGVLIMDVDGDFPDGGFGAWEMAQDTANKPQQGFWSTFTIEDIPIDAPVGPGFPFYTGGLSVANLSNADTIHPPMGNDTSIWSVDQSTPDAPWTVSSPPNNGDFACLIDGAFVNLAGGVMLATVRENREGFDIACAEVASTGAFGDDNRGVMSFATAHAVTGAETNVNLAAAYFPFADFVGGHQSVTDNDIIAASPLADYALTHLVTPDPNDQDGLWDLAISGRTPQDGLLFTVGGSNEDNMTAAAPTSNGTSWRVSVRDSYSVEFGGPTTFELDDWSFVYHPINHPGLVGGFVTGFDGNGDAMTSLSAGDYSLSQEDDGLYRLTVPGQTPEDGVLMLTSGELGELEDGTEAPLDRFLTYEADGDDFLIQQIDLWTINSPSDGAFAFAYLPFGAGDVCLGDCDGNGVLNIVDFVCFQTEWQNQTALGDCDGNGVYNIVDFVCFQIAFQAGCN